MSRYCTRSGIMRGLRWLPLFVLAIALPLASPGQEQQALRDTGTARFRVASESSWLRVLVYRGGLLRGLGHNHVISHSAITGTVMVARDPLQSTLDLTFGVAELVVDDPDERALSGADFPGRIPETDISGTRANMLGRKLLHVEDYPSIRIRSGRISGNLPELEIEAAVNIRGAEFTVVFPATVELASDSFVASGQLQITHGDLGLKPFKAALGTLRVRDALVLQYEISGTRVRVPGDIHFIL